MSEHNENLPLPPPIMDPPPVDISKLPPLPPSPVSEPEGELTSENLEKHNEFVETTSHIDEPKTDIVDEATRLLNEVRETDNLITEQQKELENVSLLLWKDLLGVDNKNDKINFAIKGSTIKQFLSANDITTKWANKKEEMDTKDIYQLASKQTVMVVCHN